MKTTLVVLLRAFSEDVLKKRENVDRYEVKAHTAKVIFMETGQQLDRFLDRYHKELPGGGGT